MRYFPVFLDLRRQPVLVLGSGEIGQRKASALRLAGAEVTLRDVFDPADLHKCRFAVGADAATQEIEAMAHAATHQRIPVNVVDRPDLCTAIMPAIIDRDPVTIAIGSEGTAPVLARLLRQRIEAVVPPGIRHLATLADMLRAETLRRLPDLALRRRVLERIFTGRTASLAVAGRVEEARASFIAELNAPADPRGIVYLVGAGPGDADLLTLRAHRLLGEADVIVHDRLVSDAVLAMARRDAERIFVGKARARHCMRQDDINALLVRLGRAGKRVVRLKGGDPFIFGRGGEEAEALQTAGVACEIVPGITAALGCAASAGVALTHRNAAQTVTFATGHCKEGRLILNFAALAQLGGTLAVYMGTHTLEPLCLGLLDAGMDPALPAALVQDGGTDHARVLRAELGTLVERSQGWSSQRPTMVLIGKVVGRSITNFGGGEEILQESAAAGSSAGAWSSE